MYECLECIVEHPAAEVRQARKIDERVVDRTGAYESPPDLCDVDRVIPDPLDVRDHFEGRADHAQVTRDGLLGCDQAQTLRLDVQIQLIHRVVTTHDVLDQLQVTG